MGLIIPKDYNPFLSLRQTQKAVKIIKDVLASEYVRGQVSKDSTPKNNKKGGRN